MNPPSAPDRRAGFWNGLAGVAIFSGSLPATRIAVAAFDPFFLTAARAALAGMLGALLLAGGRVAMPTRRELAALVGVAAGVVVGFPLMTALALQHITAARSVVFVGLLPLATAVVGVLRAGERPRPAFWAFAALGAAGVAGFAAARGGADSPASPGMAQHDAWMGDAWMLGAVIVCGWGYAEGGRLARRLGGWQVICWALLISWPCMAALAGWTWPARWDGIGLPAWVALGYVAVFSMLVGFVFWYRGLALGGIAAVGQLQLLQPFMGLALAAWLLHERVTFGMMLACTGVVLCVAAARRAAAAPRAAR